MTPIFYATKKDFTSPLVIHNTAGYEAHLHTLEGELEIIVRKRKKPVSDQQYGYYFGVILPLMCLELWGQDDRAAIREMHMAMKMLFLSEDRNGIQTVRSMSRAGGFTKDDMMQMIDRVIHYGSTEFNIQFPEPNQVQIPEYYHKFE